jgi:trimeric autotransporter adhesin
LTVHADAALTSPLALPVMIENVAVENGRFRVDADFGPLLRAGMPSAWLEIAVRDAGSKGDFDRLAQREKIALDKAIAACWSSTGDDGSNPAINFLGTRDPQPFELRVNNQRAARFEPNAISPNLLQGSPVNAIASGVRGAVIAGGGAALNADPDVGSENLNQILDHYGTVGGGVANTAGRTINAGTLFDAAFATVGGGRQNTASAQGSVVAGGEQNDAGATNAAVAGGVRNDARATAAFIGGGLDNDISPDGSGAAIGGGSSNEIDALRATIGGGQENTIPDTGAHASIGGGFSNIASGGFAHVGGGRDNVAFGPDSVIGGGDGNSNGGDGSTIAGGRQNVTAGDQSAVGGGFTNRATGNNATVAGGSLNQARGAFATVSGGIDNCAGGEASWAGGSAAIVRGNGCGNLASAGHAGTFLWADSSTTNTLSSFAPNQFMARAAGGFTLLTNASGTTGVRLTAGSGAFDSLSDRNLKANIAAIDPRRILDALVGIPIATWNYTSQSADIRHIGPMAQDFAAAFKLGTDERHISTVDADGVALAAIQGLNAKLEAENAAQRDVIARLEARIDAIESIQAVSSDATVAGR